MKCGIPTLKILNCPQSKCLCISDQIISACENSLYSLTSDPDKSHKDGDLVAVYSGEEVFYDTHPLH